jgi:drug/metabolite transporter (DMT)-like permease
MPTKNPHAYLPVISCLIAATLWGLLWYPLRIMEGMGISGLWASLLIYTATLIPLLPVLWINRCGTMRRPLALLLIGITAGWANLGFILALLEGHVVRVLLLFYLSPIWTVLLGKFLLKEYISILAWFSIVMAMCGAGIMLWQPEEGILLPTDAADILAITAGFAFAIMNVMIRKTGDIPIVMKMGTTCLGVLLLAVAGIFVMQSPPPVLTPVTLGYTMGVGCIGMLAMIYTAQYGVTHLPVHRSAVIFLFEIVAGAVSAALLTNEIVTIREWTGGLLVVLAAWITSMEVLQPVASSKKSLS